MKNFISEFKKFALKGNPIELAVAVIIGGAFGKIVSSLVNDILMPPLGLFLGQMDMSRMGWVLGMNPEGQPIVLRYGMFLNALIHFVIIGFSVFMIVRAINKLKSPPPVSEPTTRSCPQCLSQIPLKASKCSQCCSEVAPA